MNSRKSEEVNEWNAPGPAVGTSRSSSSDGIDCAYLCEGVKTLQVLVTSMNVSTTTTKMVRESKRKGCPDVDKERRSSWLGSR